MKMKIKKMKNYKTTKEKWELKMKEKEPLQCWIVKIISLGEKTANDNNLHFHFVIAFAAFITFFLSLLSFSNIPVSPNVNCKVGENPKGKKEIWESREMS
jgi:hypothetical protein